MIDFVVVLDAQRQTLFARDQLVQAQVAQATALVAIYRALGGGWTDAAGVEPRTLRHPSLRGPLLEVRPQSASED